MAPQNTPRRGHAVVLGGSLAGICAATALSRHMDSVTLVERDSYPDAAAWRRGVPQARHTHNILGAGQAALEDLFPGLRQELLAAGMNEVRIPRDMRVLLPSGWMASFSTGHSVVSGTRNLLDLVIMRRVRREPRIQILERTFAVGLFGTPDRVEGVRIRAHGAAADASEELAADFVVDATGRTSRAPDWLAELGCGTPEESVVDAGTAYATAVFEPPEAHRADWKCLLLQATPAHPHAGILNPIEEGRWMVSLASLGGARPPTDHVGFLDHAKGLRHPVLYEAIRDAKPIGEIHRSGRTENRRRHYERLARWPDRFLVLGDAAGSFNPSYGQGISVAAQSALDLDSAFAAAARSGGDPAQGTAGPLRTALARRIDAAWNVSAGTDLTYPAVDGGTQRLPDRLGAAYMKRVLSAATVDPVVARALLDVAHLLAPAQALARPRVLLGALLGAHRSRGTAPRGATRPPADRAQGAVPGSGIGSGTGTGSSESRQIIDVYRRRAKRYDLTSNRLYLIGQRTMEYKRLALEQLRPRPGETVVDAGCGTGQHLIALAEAVGPTGRVIGIDLTDRMLDKARERVRAAGLKNVELLQADLCEYEFPEQVDAVLACYSLTLPSGFDGIIERGVRALAPGGRFVMLDYKLASWFPRSLLPAIQPVIKPFGGDISMATRRPYLSLERYADDYRLIERYGGCVFVAVGTRAPR